MLGKKISDGASVSEKERERENEREKKMNRRYEKVRSVSFRNSCIVNKNENGH